MLVFDSDGVNVVLAVALIDADALCDELTVSLGDRVCVTDTDGVCVVEEVMLKLALRVCVMLRVSLQLGV